MYESELNEPKVRAPDCADKETFQSSIEWLSNFIFVALLFPIDKLKTCARLTVLFDEANAWLVCVCVTKTSQKIRGSK